jgi:hypothetical protein
VLYVELITPQDTILQQHLLRIIHGFAIGDFKLPIEATSGIYRVRAYTRWMRNFDEAFFFERKIPVVQTTNPPQHSTTPEIKTFKEMAQVDFFPEGGDLIHHMESKIAFKVIDPQGEGIPVEGTVLDKDNKTITSFKTIKEGMGIFNLKPQAEQHYTAHIHFPDGSQADYPLPKAKIEGLHLMLSNLDTAFVRVAIRSNLKEESTFTLIGQVRGAIHLMHSDKIPLGQQITLKIPKAKFPTGIVQLTLFDEKNRPQAERLFFIDHHDDLKIEMTTTEKQYHPRDKITLNLKAKNKTETPLNCHFSVAVTDKNLVKPSEDMPHILSYFLLHSDLKGRIIQPNQYFEQDDFSTRLSLDLLMMTQGWRRFLWKDILKDSLPLPTPSFTVQQGLDIQGTALNASGKPFKDLPLLAIFPEIGIFKNTQTNQEGHFRIEGLHFADTLTTIFQVGKRIEPQIMLENPQALSPSIQKSYHPLSKDSISANYLKNREKELQVNQAYKLSDSTFVLDEITIEDYKIEEDVNRSGSVLHSGDWVDYQYDAKQLETMNSIENLFRQIPGARPVFDQTGLQTGINFSRGVFSTNNQPALILWDGVRVPYQQVLGLNTMTIQRVEILKDNNAAIYGSDAAGGVIAIFSKSGADYPNIGDSKVANAIIQGYYQYREFYMPDYENLPNEQRSRPDYRSTIFWHPLVLTNKGGEAEVSFFATDNSGFYQIIIEGIGIDGTLGRKIMEVEVKE